MAAETPATTDQVIVADLLVTGGRWTDRTLQTASWYDIHELTPGAYPLTAYSVNWHATPGEAKPYSFRTSIPSTLVECYRVNRLFTASSAKTTHPNKPSHVSWDCYGYELRDGWSVMGGLATVRVRRDHPDRHTVTTLDVETGRHVWQMDKPDPGLQVYGRCSACGEVVTPAVPYADVEAAFAGHRLDVALAQL